jgi:hypothetical protein
LGTWFLEEEEEEKKVEYSWEKTLSLGGEHREMRYCSWLGDH